MISLIFGNLGSGKTASVVRAMTKTRIPVFSNIRCSGMDHVHVIEPDMLIKEKLLKVKKDGTPVTTIEFNEAFWKEKVQQLGSMHIVLDEFHLMMDARRPTAKINKIVADFLAMGRRIGQVNTEGEQGSFTLITQLERRVDIISKELATNVQWTIGHKRRACTKCDFSVWQTNEEPKQFFICPRCDANTKEVDWVVEIFLFQSYQAYMAFFHQGVRSYYFHGFIHDIASYFNRYDTRQWEDMLHNYY